jgi:hypothetical protein
MPIGSEPVWQAGPLVLHAVVHPAPALSVNDRMYNMQHFMLDSCSPQFTQHYC